MPPAEPIDMTWLLLESLIFPTVILLAVAAVYLFFGRHSWRYMRKQSDYLDHQRNVNEKALEQNKAFEAMIAQQYAETNVRSDRALAQADEAMRLHAAALDQLMAMNAKLERIAASVDATRPASES